MTHLYLFTLGPVQSFIAQARKVQDLHSGSELLSELCKVGAAKFDEFGTVIFPEISSPSIPNRFLGKVQSPQEDLAKIGAEVEKAVRAHWLALFEKEVAPMLNGESRETAYLQIKQHLDIQWLFETVAADSEEGYREAYRQINKKLNALKNTRPFHTIKEGGRKCNLDGERQVCFYRKSDFEQQNKDNASIRKGNPLFASENVIFDYDEKTTHVKLRHIQPGEGLSAVSMLKRCKDFSATDFASTAEFALAETIQAVRTTENGEAAFQAMVKLFEYSDPKHLNWQLFYPENLNDGYLKKQGLQTKKLSVASDIQKEVAKAAKALGCNLEKYYALVVFDGDNMGKLWSGDDLKPGEKLETFHTDLSKALSAFSATVDSNFKDKKRGWVIYAGGDDFMGFFNLHHLFTSLSFLHEEYNKIVSKPLEGRLKDNKSLTFSTGICIAHYKEPLALVLTQARDLEHKAKNLRDQKDAVGIGIIPGSGQMATTILASNHIGHIEYISNALKSSFSNAFINKARLELTTLLDEDGRLGDLATPGKRLLERYISRSCTIEDAHERKEAITNLQLQISQLLEATSNVPAFLDALEIADFINRQTSVSPQKQPA